jgi:hypothetical protein
MAAFSDTTAMGRYDYQYDHAAEPMEPDPQQTIEHAIGDVIIAFEELDEAIAGAISGILNRGDEFGRIVTSQLAFRNKVDMFGALVKHDRPNSKWAHDFRVPGIQRSKFTARVKHLAAKVTLRRLNEIQRPSGAFTKAVGPYSPPSHAIAGSRPILSFTASRRRCRISRISKNVVRNMRRVRKIDDVRVPVLKRQPCRFSCILESLFRMDTILSALSNTVGPVISRVEGDPSLRI